MTDLGEAIQGVWQAWPEAKEGKGECFFAAREGQIIGADRAFHFGGEYVLKDGDIIVTFTSKRYADGDSIISIWGGREGQQLVLKGPCSPLEMHLSGAFAGERDGATQVLMRKVIGWGRR